MEKPLAPSRHLETSAPRILGIEDDLSEVVILERAVRARWGEAVIDWAFTVDQARAFLRQRSYDVVLVDYSLGVEGGGEGRQSGFDVWEEAYEQNLDASFAFITSLPYDQFLKLVGPRRVAPAFLSKPVHPKEVATLIAAIAERKS